MDGAPASESSIVGASAHEADDDLINCCKRSRDDYPRRSWRRVEEETVECAEGKEDETYGNYLLFFFFLAPALAPLFLAELGEAMAMRVEATRSSTATPFSSFSKMLLTEEGSVLTSSSSAS